MKQTFIQQLGGNTLTNNMVEFARSVLYLPTDKGLALKKGFMESAAEQVAADESVIEGERDGLRSQKARQDQAEVEFWYQKFDEDNEFSNSGLYYTLQTINGVEKEGTLQALEPSVLQFEKLLLKGFPKAEGNTHKKLAATYETLLLADKGALSDEEKDFAFNALLRHTIKGVSGSTGSRTTRPYAYSMTMLTNAQMAGYEKMGELTTEDLFSENVKAAKAEGLENVYEAFTDMHTKMLVFGNLENAERQLQCELGLK